MADVPPGFDQWCLVELMGHRRVAARVTEEEIFGQKFARLDTPATGRTPARTAYHQPAAIYALHPTTQEIVQAMAARWNAEPVSRYELERALPAAQPDPDDAGTPTAWVEAPEAPDPDELADMLTYTEDPAMRDDQELPGMWSTADFTGGQEEVRPPAGDRTADHTPT